MSNLTIQSFMESKQPIKPMTKDEEFKLIKLAQQGDRVAYDKMFKQWIPFLHSIVIKYSKNHKLNEYIEDAVQECSISFDRAIKKFDISKNKRFSTYLYHWARQALDDFQRKNTMGQYYPRGIVTQTNKYQTAHKNLLSQLEHEPTIEQLSEYLGWSKKVVKNVQKYLFKNNIVSLDYVSKQGLKADDVMPGKDIDIDKDVEIELLQNKINLVLDNLNTRDKYLIESRYGLNNQEVKNLTQISREFGISSQAVQNATKKAETKLRYWLEQYNLKDFLK